MPRYIVSRRIAPPGSRYSHGVIHSAKARRLVLSGQVGVLADGSLVPDLEGQMEAAWENLFAILKEAGMAPTDLIKITAFVTVPGSVALHRMVRDKWLAGHAPASTYLEVTGLAQPEYLYELEGEAVCEEADMIADTWSETVDPRLIPGSARS